MRLRSLNLDRFGHFTDQSYDFGAAKDRPDFHIIYGANEAGKTTTMEAVLRLLYGFPARDGYAFKHQRANLQVSAQVDIDGQLRGFRRVSKTKNALLDHAGAVLPEAAFAAHLGGLSETDYRNLLCLDDETIERGGEEIAQARGDIGRLLFSAAAGVADLSTVLETVRDKADGIWRKRGRTTQIADLKRALAEVEKDIRAMDISAGTWRGLKKSLKDAADLEHQAKQTRNDLQKALQTVEAKRRALPVLDAFNAIEARITPLSHLPQHLDFDPENLVSLVAQTSQATTEIARLTQDIDTMETTVARIDIPPQAVDLNSKLDALDTLRSRDETARLDLPRRQDTLRDAQKAMVQAGDDLGGIAQDELQTLAISQAAIARLEAARETVRGAETAAQAEGREVAALTDRHAQAKEDWDRAAQSLPQGQTISAILAAYDLDRLTPELAQAHQDQQRAAGHAHETLRALGPLADGTYFADVPPCPTHLIHAQTWAQTVADLGQSIAATQDSVAQLRAQAAARQSQSAALISTGAVVPDAQAKALQDERDGLWHAHRNSMSDTTAAAFEQAMKALDDMGALRVTQARDLGQLRQIDQDHAEAQTRADHAQTRLEDLQSQLAAVQTQVDDAAAGVGLATPMLAAQWQHWVQLHSVADRAAQDVLRLQDDHRAVQARADQLLLALRPRLCQEAPDCDTSHFETALATARHIAQAEQTHIRAAEKAQDAALALAADVTRRENKLKQYQVIADSARTTWTDMVTEILGDAVAPDLLITSLDPLRILREQNDKRAEAARRVATMEADQAQFKTLVTDLANAQNIPIEHTPAATFSTLRRHAQQVEAAQAQSGELTDKIAQARTDLQAKQDTLNAIQQQVTAMGQAFPAHTHDNTLETLRPLAAQTQQVNLDRAELDKLERALIRDLGAAHLSDVREIFKDTSAIALNTESEVLAADLAAAEQHVTDAIEARVTAAQALAHVTGDDDIAALTERKATLELELEDAALEHLEFALGHRVADEAIRRYRDTHRSGMMAATERCFSALTQGAYTRLITQPEGTAETLLAVDAAGATKRAADMSKGTRFQLYLALRAAAYEQLVAQGTCLPFFCDDIFETFDEDRTRAACRVMEQIGRTGQAIYLTHHRHVVEIAKEVCDTPPMIHEV